MSGSGPVPASKPHPAIRYNLPLWSNPYPLAGHRLSLDPRVLRAARPSVRAGFVLSVHVSSSKVQFGTRTRTRRIPRSLLWSPTQHRKRAERERLSSCYLADKRTTPSNLLQPVRWIVVAGSTRRSLAIFDHPWAATPLGARSLDYSRGGRIIDIERIRGVRLEGWSTGQGSRSFSGCSALLAACVSLLSRFLSKNLFRCSFVEVICSFFFSFSFSNIENLGWS